MYLREVNHRNGDSLCSILTSDTADSATNHLLPPLLALGCRH